jgi:hypothetical protein
MAHRETRRRVLLLVLLATVILAATIYGHGSPPPPSSSGEGQQIGKILTVQKVLENRYFVSRYPQIYYYLLYIAVRTSDQTYCVSTKLLSLTRSMICFLRRTKKSSLCSRARILRSEHRVAGQSRLTWWTRSDANRYGRGR